MEKYFVDGEEVLRLRSFAVRGSRKFTVGKGNNKHEVEIKFDFFPNLKSWIVHGNWIAEVYVDGVLAIDDLTPKLRSKVRFYWKIAFVVWAVLLIDILRSYMFG